MGAAFEIQKSINSVLEAGLDVPVYDSVPENAAYPYVVIGDDTLVDFSADGKTGFDATVTIHTWSSFDGMSQVKALMGYVYDLLNRQDYGINGFNLLGSDSEFEETFLEADGVVRHGVQRFRLILIKE